MMDFSAMLHTTVIAVVNKMLETNKIHLGDCLELMNQIDDSSIGMILCDLPYGVTECKWDSLIPFDALWAHYGRIIKPKGAIVLTATQPFAAALIMSRPQWFRHEWIWEKDNGSNPFHVKHMPFQVHEHILVFGKEGVNYYPQMVTGKAYFVAPKQKDMQHLGQVRRGRIPTINTGTRYPRSVIKFNKRDTLKIHPTQKPQALFEYLIKTYSLENDLILDNCSGSGTTAAAALATNRQFICIEKDPVYFAKSLERILTRSSLLL